LHTAVAAVVLSKLRYVRLEALRKKLDEGLGRLHVRRRKQGRELTVDKPFPGFSEQTAGGFIGETNQTAFGNEQQTSRHVFHNAARASFAFAQVVFRGFALTYI